MTDEQKSFSELVAATANARYIHTSLALRCLLSNLGPLASHAVMMEFTIDEKPMDVAEKILCANPSVVLFSVYIWNTELLSAAAALIRRIRPTVHIIAGGPEVSFSPESHPIFPYVDRIVKGEGEAVLAGIARDLLDGKISGEKIIAAPPLDLETVALPYGLYTDADIRHRILYIEASRGCPLGCEFCLSSLDKTVRRFPEKRVIAALTDLWQRGARQFKFVDRALHLAVTDALLDFFLDKKDDALFLHFELIPDRLPLRLLLRLKDFPKGRVQVEAGLQTLNKEVSRRINRKQDIEKALSTLRTLRQETGIHIHSDLVIGLPGESVSSFATGFDRLFSLGLHEIQVGILKKLRGAPISRHDDNWQMIYNPSPPYDILQNRDIDFQTMQRLKRFAKFFDLVCNRGNFRCLIPFLVAGDSPFERLMHLSTWMYEKTGRAHGIAFHRLADLLLQYAVEEKGILAADAKEQIKRSFKAAGRTDQGRMDRGDDLGIYKGLPLRQQRHL